jgi:RimJ/RimL family protein N-acetyltransferase
VKRRIVINDPRTAQFIADSVGSTDCECHGSVGLEVDGQIVAGATFDNFNGKNVFIHFSSARSLRVFSRDLLRMVFGFAFGVLKVQRVSGAFSSANRKVCRLGEIIGFKFEARLRDACPDGDMMIYRLNREDCRFLP